MRCPVGSRSLPAALTLSLSVLIAVAAAAQDFDTRDYPRIDLDDLAEPYRRWLEEEVVWILTEAERDAFVRLDSDAKRDRFIDEFWRQRDPTPGTPRNEYLELHYERVDYATRQFGRDTPLPGWRTDRGRAHILLGEPRSVSRFPSSLVMYPAELWFYQADPALGLPPFFHLLFFRDFGAGDYRLYSPLVDTPMRLLTGAGQVQARINAGDAMDSGIAMTEEAAMAIGAYEVMRDLLDGEVASAAISLIPSEAGMLAGMSPMRSDLLLAQIFRVPEMIMPDATWAYRVLAGVTESEVRFETLPVRAIAVAWIDPSGAPFIHLAARMPGNRLNLRAHAAEWYLTYEVGVAQANGQRQLFDTGERVVEAALDEARAREVRTGDVLYLERFTATPGHRTVSATLGNNVSREFGIASFDILVPRSRPGRVVGGGAVLCREVGRLGEVSTLDEVVPFQVGDLLVLPTLDGPYDAATGVIVFHQVLVPPGSEGAVEVTYAILDEDGTLVAQTVVAVNAETADGHGVINRSSRLNLRGIDPGDYRVRVEVEGAVERFPELLSMRVVDAAESSPLVLQARRHPPATDPAVMRERARQLRADGDVESAVAVLEALLRRAPGDEDATALQIALLADSGRHAELTELLTPRLSERPNEVPLLLHMAEAKAALGEHYDAIRYFERARLAGAPESSDLLNRLAAEYHAAGRLEQARDLLRRSLTLTPDQPEIRRLLQRLGDEAQGPREPVADERRSREQTA